MLSDDMSDEEKELLKQACEDLAFLAFAYDKDSRPQQLFDGQGNAVILNGKLTEFGYAYLVNQITDENEE